MKLKAEVGHWSSVVGNSVHLIAPDGRMVGQIAFLCHDDTLRDKDVQADLASVICDAINAPATNPAARDREALIEVLTARATAAEAALAAAMEGAVRVKPLEWFEVARGNNGYGKWEAEGYVVQKIEGLFLINFAGSYKNEWRFTSVGSAKAAAEADYNRRILAALEPNPAAQNRDGSPIAATLTYRNWRGEVSDRVIIPRRVWFGSTEWHPEPQWLLTAWDAGKNAERDFALCDFLGNPGDRDALIAATLEMAAQECREVAQARLGEERDAANACADRILEEATQPQTDALEAVRREARAEGMRMAADLFTGSDLWEEAGIREWILAAAQTAADSVMGRA